MVESFCEYVAHTVLTPFYFSFVWEGGVQGVAYLSGLDMSWGMRLASCMNGWMGDEDIAFNDQNNHYTLMLLVRVRNMYSRF